MSGRVVTQDPVKRVGGFDRERLPDVVSYFEAEGMTLKGRGRWRTTRCVFHGGSDSMRVNTLSGGWCCMACSVKGGDVLAYAMAAHGLDFLSAARQLGAWTEGQTPKHGSTPKILAPRDAMEVIAAELGVVWVVAADLVRGVIPEPKDWERFTTAAGRIEALVMEYRV